MGPLACSLWQVIRQLKVDQAKELTKLRQEFDQTAKDLQSKYEKKMRNLRDDLELARKQEARSPTYFVFLLTSLARTLT